MVTTRSQQSSLNNEDPIEMQPVAESAPNEALSQPRAESPPPNNVAEAYPEGGYGWVVVASCFTLALTSLGLYDFKEELIPRRFFFVGVSYSFGLLEARLVADGVASATTISFVGSLGMASISIFGTLATLLNRKLGSKQVLIYGSALLGGGLALSGFTAHKVAGLFITQGLVSGLGTSLMLVSVSSLPSQYFLRRRGLATGIILSAGGVGGAVWSLLLNLLLDQVGVQWTYHILGLVALAICLPACLLIRERFPRHSAPIWDTRLLLDLRVFTIFISGAFAVFPLLVPPYFLPLYGTSNGLSGATSAGLVAGFNVASAVGRVGFGFLADKIGAVNALMISEIANAMSLLVIWPFGKSLVALVVFVIVSGLSVGAFFSLMPTVTASVVTPAQFPTAMSMVVTSWAGGYLFGSPIAAAILTAYGGTDAGLKPYLPAMFYAGGITAGCAAMLAGMKWKHTGTLWSRI